MTWLLIVLAYATADLAPAKPVVREFPTWELCRAERDHLWSQAREADVVGGIIAWCQPKG